MNVQSTSQALRAAQAASTEGPQKMAYQTQLLKKSLDDQKQQAAELLKLLEQKGQNLDIRV
jgi:hypothetical protein